MNEVAEIDEFVIYTGNVKNGCDRDTVDIMRFELVPGHRYNVKEVINLGLTIDSLHYKLSCCPYLFPCRSFMRDMIKVTREKYNLL